MLPYDVSLTLLARELRDHQTLAETRFWQIIRNRKLLSYKFIRQKPISTYIADFYCHELQLIIELDGNVHLTREGYDTYRTKELNAMGLTVIRYTNDQILTDLPRVKQHLEKVAHFLKSHPSQHERGRG